MPVVTTAENPSIRQVYLRGRACEWTDPDSFRTVSGYGQNNSVQVGSLSLMRNHITGIQSLAPVTRRIDGPVESIIDAIEAIDTALAGGRLETRSRWRPVASAPVPAWEVKARLVVCKEVLR